jgi:carotenoid cleavage dioxygenase
MEVSHEAHQRRPTGRSPLHPRLYPREAALYRIGSQRARERWRRSRISDEEAATMSEASQEETPFHLTGNFAPVFDERTELALEVVGTIPPELNGRFFRNGSNPKTGWSPHWFLGNGMVHGVELGKGNANWYRNRYVQTPLLDNPEAERFRPDGTVDRTLSCANTHVIRHGGRILALEEGSFPFELSTELETIGAHDYGGKLNSAMTAHPRICGETGELLFFGYGQQPPYLVYYRVTPDGTLVQREEIDVKGPTMMHDWNVTRNHVVFMDLPMVFDVSAIAEGGMPLRWSDDYGARLGVMPRDGRNADVTWYEVDPCYVFHAMNGYDDGDRIILDVCHMQKLVFSPADGEGGTPPRLYRWEIDQKAGTIKGEYLDDQPAEFPRVHDRTVGVRHRYGYTVGLGADPTSFGGVLQKYDRESGAKQIHPVGAGRQAGEPVFAAAPGASGEDEGWILTFVYDESSDSSELVIIDASEFEKAPVARIVMPRRVPFGFHGSWLPDEA